MDFKLEDVINVSLLQDLQEKLNEIYSFPSAIIDMDGKILTAVAWQDICTKFHRVNPQCEKDCLKSDQYIFEHIFEANPAVIYKCPHGLIDSATPIIIDGKHLGNFFTGQFFLEKPDKDFFVSQAKKYGFDETSYLEAVDKVPVWTNQKLTSYVNFIKGFISIIAGIGLNNLKEREANKKLREEEERTRTILKTAMDGFWILDKQGYLLEVNETYSRMSGYSEQELSGMNVSEIEVYESVDMIAAHIKNLIEVGSDRFITKHKRKNGTLYDAEVSVMYHPDYEIIVGFIRDITKQKESEHELIQAKERAEENEQKYKLLYNYTPVMLHSSDVDGNLMSVNDYWLQFTGYELHEVIGTKASNYLSEASKQLYRSKIAEIAKTGFVNNVEVQAVKKNGEVADLLISSKIFYHEGKPQYTLTTSIDVSERKRISIALQQRNRELKILNREYLAAKEKAEESDRLKTAFLQNMSHEIRTPMNAIMGFSELLVRNFDNKLKLERYSQIITQRCTDLLGIINDMLDIAKIESGQLPVNSEPCDIKQLFEEIMLFFNEFQKRLEKTNILLSSNISDQNTNFQIFTDKIKLKQILINLITNAFKFTDSGQIVFGYKMDTGAEVTFFVSDTGVGIPPEKFNNIFERFIQLDTARKLPFGGTGLGLSIVKGLVNLLGGKIWLESELDKGTTFYFTIPV